MTRTICGGVPGRCEHIDLTEAISRSLEISIRAWRLDGWMAGAPPWLYLRINAMSTAYDSLNSVRVQLAKIDGVPCVMLDAWSDHRREWRQVAFRPVPMTSVSELWREAIKNLNDWMREHGTAGHAPPFANMPGTVNVLLDDDDQVARCLKGIESFFTTHCS